MVFKCGCVTSDASFLITWQAEGHKGIKPTEAMRENTNHQFTQRGRLSEGILGGVGTRKMPQEVVGHNALRSSTHPVPPPKHLPVK